MEKDNVAPARAMTLAEANKRIADLELVNTHLWEQMAQRDEKIERLEAQVAEQDWALDALVAAGRTRDEACSLGTFALTRGGTIKK